jgi:hypothetical protein
MTTNIYDNGLSDDDFIDAINRYEADILSKEMTDLLQETEYENGLCDSDLISAVESFERENDKQVLDEDLNTVWKSESIRRRKYRRGRRDRRSRFKRKETMTGLEIYHRIIRRVETIPLEGLFHYGSRRLGGFGDIGDSYGFYDTKNNRSKWGKNWNKGNSLKQPYYDEEEGYWVGPVGTRICG